MFSNMIQKILNRIKGWNTKFLSPGGKYVLIKHVLPAMSSHLLVVMQPPETIYNIIEKALNRFFWNGSDGTKRHHWVSWNNLSFPFIEVELISRNLGTFVKLSVLNNGGDSGL